MTATQYSYWRVWIDDDQVRVARDRIVHDPEGTTCVQPEHLERDGDGISWTQHEEGAAIPAIEISDFIDWLDRRTV